MFFLKFSLRGRHVIGKQHAVAIKRDNSNISNDLSRFKRLTKVVSKSENIINNTFKLWQAFELYDFFSLRQILLSVFQ